MSSSWKSNEADIDADSDDDDDHPLSNAGMKTACMHYLSQFDRFL